jgi:predicted transcriptional regulator
MNFTLNQLRIFLKISELQNITKAAEELHLTQPAVSIQLKNFQEQFEIPLVEVVNKKVYITDLQRRKLILESASNDIENISNESKKLGESILDEVKKQTNLDLGILLSWSASIGGFMSPLNDIIQGKFPEFSDSDRFLVLSGLLFSVLYQNKKFFNRS